MYLNVTELLNGKFCIMYILPHSAKCDYRLVQEDTEAMVRNSAPVKYYGTWYIKNNLKISKKAIIEKLYCEDTLFYKIFGFAEPL